MDNSAWDTIVIIFTDVARNATVDGQKDEGNCYATLGQTCVQDYTTVISDSIIRQVASNITTPIIPSPPASCGNRLSSASIINRKSLTPVSPSNFDIIIAFDSKFANGSAYIYSSSPAHNASNDTYYQAAATRVWPIVVIQGGENGTGIWVTSMSCLRANATTKGSEGIGSVPGAAVRIKTCSWVVMSVAGLVGVFLM